MIPFADRDRYESRVARNIDAVLALLVESGYRGTFFVLTRNAEHHPEIVRRIADTTTASQ
ncbi:MAG: polysaccharide deacetylase family protein [Deltaproteobacteria bacterium]|nr:polysaccharide deacetylase family protein [Deltaproteobacteria bacterium]